MSEPILLLSEVHTDIGQYQILHGVSFTVPESGVYVLLGRNGAGKTTTLRTIMGLWRVRKGSIRFAVTVAAAVGSSGRYTSTIFCRENHSHVSRTPLAA